MCGGGVTGRSMVLCVRGFGGGGGGGVAVGVVLLWGR